MTPIEVTTDELYEPVNEDNRYGLYRLVLVNGQPLPVQICTTSRDGIGAALVQLADDRDDGTSYETEVVGILDRQERRWITSLWTTKL